MLIHYCGLIDFLGCNFMLVSVCVNLFIWVSYSLLRAFCFLLCRSMRVFSVNLSVSQFITACLPTVFDCTDSTIDVDFSDNEYCTAVCVSGHNFGVIVEKIDIENVGISNITLSTARAVS